MISREEEGQQALLELQTWKKKDIKVLMEHICGAKYGHLKYTENGSAMFTDDLGH